MTQAVYVRLYEEDLNFVKEYSKKKKLNQSKVINTLLHGAVQQQKLDIALEEYKEGFKTIRESALFADMDYRAFFNELSKRNLLGPSSEEQEQILKDTREL